MNVKPGDFAKVISPHIRAGTLVSVIEPCSPAEFAMLCAAVPAWANVKQVWACKLLTGSAGIEFSGSKTYFMPGEEAWFADEYLRRIDPAPDTDVERVTDRAPATREAVPA